MLFQTLLKDMRTQALELSAKPHIIIATPGRLVDHIRSSSGAVNFKRLKFLVRLIFPQYLLYISIYIIAMFFFDPTGLGYG